MTTTTLAPLTPAELDALVTYAATHGRTWKQQLRWAWMDASEPGILQALRNQANFGPAGLTRFKLPTATEVSR